MSDKPDDINRIPIADFRTLGYLQEANRLFFHPRGLALEVTVNLDGTEQLGGVWDYRQDPEGIHFGDGMIDPGKVAIVETQRAIHLAAREQLGFPDGIQQAGDI